MLNEKTEAISNLPNISPKRKINIQIFYFFFLFQNQTLFLTKKTEIKAIQVNILG